MDKASGSGVTCIVTYYLVADAMRIDNTLYYVLNDHLGSASVVTDTSGNILGEQRYYPFGETRITTGTIYTDKLFTGQREMAGLGIYHYQARFYSPKIGRFLSADTIVPSYTNPQNLNRYSYVKNNPLIYIDPTGHAECRTEEECEDMGTTPMGTGNPHNGGGGGDDDDDEPDPSDGEPSDLVNNDGTPLPDGYYCQSSTLTCWANFAQDMATTVDFLFAGLEVVLVIGGCVAGPEGCAGGLLTSWMIFNSGPNQIESALSGLSLVLTATEDYREDQKFGESSFTSLVTFIVGGMNPDPIADLVIDGYASGYNHGFFNDISTAIMEGTLLESSPAYK